MTCQILMEKNHRTWWIFFHFKISPQLVTNYSKTLVKIKTTCKICLKNYTKNSKNRTETPKSSHFFIIIRKWKWVPMAVLPTRAQWESGWPHILNIIISGCMYSYVKLNFKAGLFSSTFWFERIFISKIGLLVFRLFTF